VSKIPLGWVEKPEDLKCSQATDQDLNQICTIEAEGCIFYVHALFQHVKYLWEE